MTENQQQRKNLLSILSKSSLSDIQTCWQQLEITPSYHCLKEPEIGMTMVRAKAGGVGQLFNIGEMTMTRTVVQLENKKIGFGYTAGRSKEKLKLIAVIDACFQVEQWQQLIDSKVLRPLEAMLNQQLQQHQETTDHSKVNFFTMVRGE